MARRGAEGGRLVLRHEYVDHVAALALAGLTAECFRQSADRELQRARGEIGTRSSATPAQLAADALAVANALADLRYPEAEAQARTAPKYDPIGGTPGVDWISECRVCGKGRRAHLGGVCP